MYSSLYKYKEIFYIEKKKNYLNQTKYNIEQRQS